MSRVRSRKLFTLMLVITLMLVALLSACSKSNTGGQENAGSAAGTTATDNGSGNDASASSGKVKELSLFIDEPWWAVKDWKGEIADEITKKTGTKLKVTIASDDKQLPLMIASGDLPDLVFTSDNVVRMSDPKISYPWNDLIEKYDPTFKIDKTRIAVNTMKDGKFYTILNGFATQEEMNQNKYALGGDGNPGIDVRQDIMDELGNPPIHTLDDFVNVLDMVKKKYPDMIPLTMDINWLEPYFLQQFGIEASFNNWYEKDGKVGYFINEPGMLDFFKFMNSLYRNGYIQAENFAYPNDQIDDQLAASGKAFAHSHTVGVAGTDNIAAEKGGKPYKFTLLPSVLSNDAVKVNSGVGWGGLFITKNNKDLETSIKFMDYLASEDGQRLSNWGIEGEHWTWNDEGYPEFKWDHSDGDYQTKTGIAWWNFLSDGVTQGLNNYDAGTQKTKALLETKDITKYKPELGLIKPQPDSEENIIKTKIDDMVKNEKVKIYLSKSEEEAVANYNNIIKQADNMGMQKLSDWANQTYQQKKDLFK